MTAAATIPEPVTIALVDVSAIYWQAWHSGGADQPADAPAHATVRKVAAIAERYPLLAVCCDAGRSWRHDADPGYKANREAKPPEASAQLRRALGILEADGYPMWLAEGFEADDVIASACAWAVAQGHRVVIVTPDKDLMQLVGPGVIVESTRWQPAPDGEGGTFPVYGPAEVEAKFGVRPSEVGDWLALVGDTSDNIPGVKGVGPKRAAELLVTYGRSKNPEAEDPGLLGVLDAARDLSTKLTPAMRTALLDGAEQLGKSRKLVTLSDNVPGIPFAQVLAPRVTKPRPRIAAAPPPKDDEETPMGLEIEATEEPETAAEPQPAMVADVPGEPARATAPEPKATTALARVTVPWSLELEPRTMSHVAWLARTVIDSRLFGSYPSPEAATVAIMRGRELGIPAMSALAAQHVIKGKLAMSADLITGLVHKSGKAEYFDCVETSDERAVFVTKRVGSPNALTLAFTIGEAQQAGYVTQGGSWAKFPTRMLQCRAGVGLARLVYPDVVGGLYMPEEL